MTNLKCECSEPGFCKRHGVEKNIRQFELCKGINCTPAQCIKYWTAWEQGRMHGQAAPVAEPEEAEIEINRGLGDTVSKFIRATTGIKPCGGCKDREALLNHWFPADTPPIEPRKFGPDTVHNLIYHVWPVRSTLAWRWNLDHILKHAEIFNGKRVVAIVESSEAYPPESVKEHLGDFTDHYIVMRNHPKLREVVTFHKLMEAVNTHRENELTFYAHAKGVRHGVDPYDRSTTVFRWAEIMYDVCLSNIDLIHEVLSDKGTAGAFRRNTGFNVRRNHKWHWTGTFFWFRNRNVIERNWRYIEKRFFGVEAWPAHLFRVEETATLLCEDTHDLYHHDYMNNVIEPLVMEWKKKYGDLSGRPESADC